MTDPAAQPAPQPAAPLTPAEDKQWAMFSHFGGILGFIPALIIFFVFKDRGAQTKAESKEALNWQITWIGAAIILGIVSAIVGAVMFGIYVSTDLPAIVYRLVTGLFGFIAWVPYLANVVFSIIGGIAINNGKEHYKYPIALRLIK